MVLVEAVEVLLAVHLMVLHKVALEPLVEDKADTTPMVVQVLPILVAVVAEQVIQEIAP